MPKKSEIDGPKQGAFSIFVTAAMVALAYLLSVTAAAAATRCERDQGYLRTAIKARTTAAYTIRFATSDLDRQKSAARRMRDQMQLDRCGTPYQSKYLQEDCQKLYQAVDENVRTQERLRNIIEEARNKENDALKVEGKLLLSVAIYCDRPAAKRKPPRRKPPRKSARPGRRKDIDPSYGPGIAAGIVWDIIRKGAVIGGRPRARPGRRCHRRRDGTIHCSSN